MLKFVTFGINLAVLEQFNFGNATVVLAFGKKD